MIVDYEGMTYSPTEIDAWERELNPDLYIQMWRRPSIGELSVIATASAAKVHLEFVKFPEEDEMIGLIEPMDIIEAEEVGVTKFRRYGPQKDFFKIKIEEALGEIDTARVMSHELGHLAWIDRLGRKPDHNWHHVERFAEYFARKITEAGNGAFPYIPPPGAIPGQQELFQADTYQNEYHSFSGKNWGEL